jgi:hypothetical protein
MKLPMGAIVNSVPPRPNMRIQPTPLPAPQDHSNLDN